MNNIENNSKRKAEVLEKVRKLMAKTTDNGASESEAESAMKKAQRLMLEWSIEEGEVNISKTDIAELVMENEFKSHEYRYWYWDVLNVIASSYDCEVIKAWVPVTGSYYRIIGTKDDREMIKTMFDMIYPVIRNVEKVRYQERLKQVSDEIEASGIHKMYKAIVMKENMPSRKIHFKSYYKGFLYGLHQKLKEDKKEFFKIGEDDHKTKYELMVVKKSELVKGYITENLNTKPRRTVKSNLDGGAFGKGKSDGNEKSLHTQLKA